MHHARHRQAHSKHLLFTVLTSLFSRTALTPFHPSQVMGGMLGLSGERAVLGFILHAKKRKPPTSEFSPLLIAAPHAVTGVSFLFGS